MLNVVRVLVVYVSALLFAAPALSQSYPSKPVRLVVPFPAGGGGDVLGRALALKLQDALGQPVIVDNRPGAGGNVGTEHVAKSAPDGYTLLFATNGTHGINPALYKSVPFDPVKDFAPIALTQVLPNVLVVNPEVPAKNVTELIEYIRARPGKVDFASAGNGTTSHLAGEIFKQQAKLFMVHIPYRGGGAAIVDVIAGRVPMMIEVLPNAMSHVKAGKLRALAVTSSARTQSAPDIPTMAEAGLPGYSVTAWTGVFAPAGTSREVVQRVASALAQIAKQPDYRERLAQLGADAVVDSSPEQFAAFVQSELGKWAQAVKASGAKVD